MSSDSPSPLLDRDSKVDLSETRTNQKIVNSNQTTLTRSTEVVKSGRMPEITGLLIPFGGLVHLAARTVFFVVQQTYTSLMSSKSLEG